LELPSYKQCTRCNWNQFSLFADDTCICASEKHECFVLCKLQRGLTSVNSWYKPWNVKINDAKYQAIYFSRRFRFPEYVTKWKEHRLVSNVKCLGVIFDNMMTWLPLDEKTAVKTLGICTRLYF
jgi:hypothetical protein